MHKRTNKNKDLFCNSPLNWQASNTLLPVQVWLSNSILNSDSSYTHAWYDTVNTCLLSLAEWIDW